MFTFSLHRLTDLAKGRIPRLSMRPFLPAMFYYTFLTRRRCSWEVGDDWPNAPCPNNVVQTQSFIANLSSNNNHKKKCYRVINHHLPVKCIVVSIKTLWTYDTSIKYILHSNNGDNGWTIIAREYLTRGRPGLRGNRHQIHLWFRCAEKSVFWIWEESPGIRFSVQYRRHRWTCKMRDPVSWVL